MMKKFLIAFVCLFSVVTLSSHAELLNFKSTAFSFRYVNERNVWTSWAEWEPSNLNITVDTESQRIYIFSFPIQAYDILDDGVRIKDETGKSILFKMQNQEGEYGNLRLRIRNDGVSQLYIDFEKFMLVYNVEARE